MPFVCQGRNSRDPFRHLGGQESVAQLPRAIGKLLSRRRAAWLSLRTHRSTANIATEDRCSVNAIQKATWRANRRLRAEVFRGDRSVDQSLIPARVRLGAAPVQPLGRHRPVNIRKTPLAWDLANQEEGTGLVIK